MSETGELGCVRVPIGAGDLLIPGVCIAEVLRIDVVRVPEDVPRWLAGFLRWRGIEVPLVSIDRLLGRPARPPRHGDPVLVLHRTRALDGLGFHGLLVRGMPHMHRLAPEDLEIVDDHRPTRLVPVRVRVDGRDALVPGLDAIEDLLLAHPDFLAPGA